MTPLNRLVVEDAAFHFFARCSSADRRRLLVILEDLRMHPDMEQGLPTKDSTGRPMRIKPAKPFMLTWWLDPWECEVRVARIERVR